jgi:hypothetical protein
MVSFAPQALLLLALQLAASTPAKAVEARASVARQLPTPVKPVPAGAPVWPQPGGMGLVPTSPAWGGPLPTLLQPPSWSSPPLPFRPAPLWLPLGLPLPEAAPSWILP